MQVDFTFEEKIMMHFPDTYKLLRDVIDIKVPLEPLWVRNQQQKSFKRGKK